MGNIGGEVDEISLLHILDFIAHPHGSRTAQDDIKLLLILVRVQVAGFPRLLGVFDNVCHSLEAIDIACLRLRLPGRAFPGEDVPDDGVIVANYRAYISPIPHYHCLSPYGGILGKVYPASRCLTSLKNAAGFEGKGHLGYNTFPGRESLRILHVIPRYWPYIGGSELYFQELSRRLAREGHEVTVFTTDAWDLEYFWDARKRRVEIEEEVHQGVRIVRLPVWHLPVSRVLYGATRRAMAELTRLPWGAGSILRAASRLTPWVPELTRQLIREGPWDVVHAANIPFESLICASLSFAQRHRIPFLLTPFVHLGEREGDRVRRQYTMPHQLAAMRQSDRVIVQTDLEGEYLASRGILRERIVRVGMGVNPEELEGGRAERFRARFGLRKPIVFTIATLAHDKGTNHLVEAMRRLWERGVEAHLVLAGPQMASFGRYFTALPPSVKERCILTGPIQGQEKLDLLAAGDLFAMPSRTDSFGIVYLEAWYYGKPVIGAWAGGVPEVIAHGQEGYLVRFGDVDELARRLEQLLRQPGKAHLFGQRGREKVLSQHTWDRKYSLIRPLYSSLTQAL